MAKIDYDHSKNIHTLTGAEKGIAAILARDKANSVLDVGCGTGTWLRAAMDAGIRDILGVDGCDIPDERLWIPRSNFQVHDLTNSWLLGRKFDIALCLEVAEHLDGLVGEALIRSLTRHADIIYFSAACPGQTGQHHINCRWPEYWQRLFNAEGFVCDDEIRWQMWTDDTIEPWYRQNMFRAHLDRNTAGTEARIPAAVHPEIASQMKKEWAAEAIRSFEDQKEKYERAENGRMGLGWYVSAMTRAIVHRINSTIESYVTGPRVSG